MAQVGDDFTHNVSLPDNIGSFDLGPDFYTNPDTPRVPWANEPGCGSCHTGYATDNLAGDPGVLVSPSDTLGNSDGIRLLSAYRQNDTKATPIFRCVGPLCLKIATICSRSPSRLATNP